LNGKRQISYLQSAQRESLVAVVTCTSPTGHFVPSLLVFPRRNTKQELINGTAPGPIHACHTSWWILSEIFFSQWFLHFIKHTKPTQEDPVILLLDGHYSHKEPGGHYFSSNHSDIICLLPHRSHEMQPRDKSFMGALKTFYCQETEKWLVSHQG
jgi:hypothetical protein